MNRIARIIIASLIGLSAVVGLANEATARAVQVERPTHEVIRHNDVIRVRDLSGRWTRLTLADGSIWRATPCRQEDSRNCWWDATERGNGIGHSFLNLNGHLHYLRPPAKATVIGAPMTGEPR